MGAAVRKWNIPLQDAESGQKCRPPPPAAPGLGGGGGELSRFVEKLGAMTFLFGWNR